MQVQRGETRQPTLRVGHEERDACVAALIDHHLQGRLGVDELDRRQRAALAAVTTDDLDLLLSDLPDRDEAPLAVTRASAPVELGDVARTAARSVLPVAPVLLGAAWFSQEVWHYSAEGPMYGALLGGVVGYAAHVVRSRFRR